MHCPYHFGITILRTFWPLVKELKYRSVGDDTVVRTHFIFCDICRVLGAQNPALHRKRSAIRCSQLLIAGSTPGWRAPARTWRSPTSATGHFPTDPGPEEDEAREEADLGDARQGKLCLFLQLWECKKFNAVMGILRHTPALSQTSVQASSNGRWAAARTWCSIRGDSGFSSTHHDESFREG